MFLRKKLMSTLAMSMLIMDVKCSSVFYRLKEFASSNFYSYSSSPYDSATSSSCDYSVSSSSFENTEVERGAVGNSKAGVKLSANPKVEVRPIINRRTKGLFNIEAKRKGLPDQKADLEKLVREDSKGVEKMLKDLSEGKCNLRGIENREHKKVNYLDDLRWRNTLIEILNSYIGVADSCGLLENYNLVIRNDGKQVKKECGKQVKKEKTMDEHLKEGMEFGRKMRSKEEVLNFMFELSEPESVYRVVLSLARDYFKKLHNYHTIRGKPEFISLVNLGLRCYPSVKEVYERMKKFTKERPIDEMRESEVEKEFGDMLKTREFYIADAIISAEKIVDFFGTLALVSSKYETNIIKGVSSEDMPVNFSKDFLRARLLFLEGIEVEGRQACAEKLEKIFGTVNPDNCTVMEMLFFIIKFGKVTKDKSEAYCNELIAEEIYVRKLLKGSEKK